MLLIAAGCVSANAQSKITFEDQTTNGAACIYGGSVSVVANPVTTGINTSAYCLDVVNNGYAPVKFANCTIATGLKTTYPYVKIKFKIAYKGYNGGSDLDYPQVDVFSSPTSPALDATEKLGTISSVWSTHASDSLVWKSAEFTVATSLLNTIPGGMLVLKLAKSKCEFLIDDIEFVPSPIYNPNVLTLSDFESNSIGEAVPYNVYWSTTSAASGTCAVVADPLSVSTKAICISPSGYNGTVNLSVTLPGGKALDGYDRLFFDMYYSSSSGMYAQPYISATSTVIYQVTSGYPSQGTSGVWNTKDYELSGMPAVNSFILKIGYTSNNSIPYYLDNIKLHAKESSSTTGVNDASVSVPLVAYSDGSFFRMNKVVDKLNLFDASGRLVRSAMGTELVSLNGLGSGMYILKAQVGNEQYLTKVMK